MEEPIVSRAKSRTIGVTGRCLNTVRNHHFVIDEPAYGGGPGEEVTPAEAFLSGVSSCAVLLIEKFAREEKFPLKAVEATIEGTRVPSHLADFQSVRLRLETAGVTQPQADKLVERFKGR